METKQKKISTKTAYLQALRDMQTEKNNLQKQEQILYVKLLKSAPESAVQFLCSFQHTFISI